MFETGSSWGDADFLPGKEGKKRKPLAQGRPNAHVARLSCACEPTLGALTNEGCRHVVLVGLNAWEGDRSSCSLALCDRIVVRQDVGREREGTPCSPPPLFGCRKERHLRPTYGCAVSVSVDMVWLISASLTA